MTSVPPAPADPMKGSFVEIQDLPKHIGKPVLLRGWVSNRTEKGKLCFITLRDGSGWVQAVLHKPTVGDALFEAASHAPIESAVTLAGEVKEDKRAPSGVEISATGFAVVSRAMEYPIANVSDQGPDFLLNHRHLWLRSRQQHAVMRVRNEIIQAIHDFFYQRGFIQIDAPIFTPSACEGTQTLFEVGYFEDKAYLTQSGQLYMEAGAMAHGKVYCFGPTFRAEKSKTRRHLTEFWMIEPEVAWCDLDQLMDLEEDFVCFIVQRALERAGEHLKRLERDTAPLEKVLAGRPFARLAYRDAAKLLAANGVELRPDDDFGAPHEDFIGTHFGKPTFVHRYPAKVKAFYMKRDPQDDSLSMSVDLIGPNGAGELIGGGQRSEDLQFLQNQINAHQLPMAAYEWYLDLRRYGTVPHSGFGLGLERTVSWVCGREHIRECIPFPRMLNRISP